MKPEPTKPIEVEVLPKEQTTGVTALDMARNASIEVIRLLLDAGAGINTKDSSGEPFLNWVFEARMNHEEQQSVELIKLLLERGAAVNGAERDGCTPLMRASAWRGHKAFEVATLLLQNGADVNAEQRDGSTPLFLAVANANPELVNLFLAKGANVNPRKGATPLSLARYLGNAAIIRRLEAAGGRE